MSFFKIVCIVSLLFFIPESVLGVSSTFDTISSTKHNMSVTGSGDIKSTTTTQICVFCHTPHNSKPKSAIWNKNDSGSNYSPYQSKSMEVLVGQPDGPSRLCLSCHDGTIAIGELRNLPGATGSGSLQMTDSATGKLTAGGQLAPNTTGFTSYIGLNLQNDHPVSFQYTDTVAVADGELADPGTWLSDIDASNPNRTPLRAGKMQCTSCHDAHGVGFDKFLKASLTQEREIYDPLNFDANRVFADDILCVYCHVKKSTSGAVFNWVGSSHQNSQVADEIYKGNNYLQQSGPVWKTSCLACHDTHTVVGGRRLLREGVVDDAPGANAVGRAPRTGTIDAADIASEETCYLCHTESIIESVLSDTASPPKVKNIEAEFNEDYHMPISTLDQGFKGGETHDVINADLLETTVDLFDTYNYVPNFAGESGVNGSRRHVECTDCHNPHRMINNSRYTEIGGVAGQGTHLHFSDTEMHENTASGVLRGTWGVDPKWDTLTWDEWPTIPAELGPVKYDIVSPNSIVNQEVTKEYHVCMKCHSSFAFGASPPTPLETGGSTKINDPGMNFVEVYTDQAKEFNPNNAGYHPVTVPTARSLADRNIGATTSPFLDPWKGPVAGTWVGDQTMYCTDCHGADIPGVGNNDQTLNQKPWGPHGSSNEYILIGQWDYDTGTPARPSPNSVNQDLCFKCHDYPVYASEGTRGPSWTGFKGYVGGTGQVGDTTGILTNLHTYHMAGGFGTTDESDHWEQNNDPAVASPSGRYYITCMNCHDGISHGLGGGDISCNQAVSTCKGYNLLSAIKAVPGAVAACVVNISAASLETDPALRDALLCIDSTSDEIPYRTSRSRLRVEDRDQLITTGGGPGGIGEGWGSSGAWAFDNCKIAHEWDVGTKKGYPAVSNGSTLRGCVQP